MTLMHFFPKGVMNIHWTILKKIYTCWGHRIQKKFSSVHILHVINVPDEHICLGCDFILDVQIIWEKVLTFPMSPKITTRCTEL
jgi:hypothetical protein